MSSLSITGEVLDMGLDSKGIIYRALRQTFEDEDYMEAAVAAEINNNIEDYNWVYGYPDSLPFNDSSFNNVTSFFSFSCIRRKHARNKTIKEIARILQRNGKLYLWDININILSISLKRKAKVILPHNEIVKIELKQSGFPGSYNLNTILPVIERYFNIDKKINYGKYFYIEAVKKDDSK